MRIGIEAQRIFRKRKGGMDIVAMEIINNLQQIDKKNEYIIYAAPGEDTSAIKETSNFKIKLINAITYFDWEQLWLPRQVKKDKIDLLHCTCNTAPLWSPVSKIITIHDTIFVEEQKWPVNVNWYQRVGNRYRSFIAPRVVNSSKKIITSTEVERKNLIEYFKIDDSKIEIVPHGVNSCFRKITDQALLNKAQAKYSLPDHFILYLGNTEPRKNIHNLLRAYSELVVSNNDVPNLAITNIHAKYLRTILRELNQENLSKRIILTGYADSNDLPALYNLADFFLYPSLREGFGLPILEAMACSTPVITSITSSMPEIAGDAALLVDPFNYQELKDAMNLLMKNDDLQEKLRARGLKRVKAFTWEVSAKKILSIYERFKENLQNQAC
jgi:glycosyltransferase involved in cell wall biosynthesis